MQAAKGISRSDVSSRGPARMVIFGSRFVAAACSTCKRCRPDVLLSQVRAPALPPRHADFGSQFHTPSNRCLRFGTRVAAPRPAIVLRLPVGAAFALRLFGDPAFTVY